MNSETENNINTVAVVAGIVAGLAVAGLVGRLLMDAHRPAGEHARDIREIISECQSTIQQMDHAMKSLHPKPIS